MDNEKEIKVDIEIEIEKDVEKEYSPKDVAAKLRRLADALENGTPFEIQIDGERIYIPANATIEFEYQRDGNESEMEIEITWEHK
jgi:amphi-Trp domain-containing protein